MSTSNAIDPATLVATLDPDAIANRLEALDDEAAALRILLRAAKARQRRQQLAERRQWLAATVEQREAVGV